MMDFSSATFWWIAAGALVAVELATGTFYMLMMAIGAAAAAIAAWMGLSFTVQLVAAAALGGGAVAAWHTVRLRQPPALPAAQDRNVNLDIGQTVQVDAWTPQRSARISYRGSAWSARYIGAGLPSPGTHVIRAIEGSELLLERSIS